MFELLTYIPACDIRVGVTIDEPARGQLDIDEARQITEDGTVWVDLYGLPPGAAERGRKARDRVRYLPDALVAVVPTPEQAAQAWHILRSTVAAHTAGGGVGGSGRPWACVDPDDPDAILIDLGPGQRVLTFRGFTTLAAPPQNLVAEPDSEEAAAT